MGIDDLRLTPELITLLYPESLVADFAESSLSMTTEKGPGLEPEAAYPSLGGNQQFLCFLVNYPDDTFIPGVQMELLNKILSACKYSLADITLVNTAHTTVNMEGLKRHFKPRVLFLWGNLKGVLKEADGLPDMVISRLGDLSVLPVANTEIMSRDNPESVELKKKLWVSLKKLFNL